VGSVSLRLRFGPHFTPLCFSILDQLEKELSASRICPFCVKLLLQVFLRGKEAQRIAHFVGQPVSECIDTPANRADRNQLVPLVSYARLGAHIAPTDVPSDGCKKSPVVALQAQGQATQGRDVSTLAPLRVLRARAPVPAWARRAVGEGVKSCPRAGCGKPSCPVR
jgi:hypothetical protein